MKISYGRVRSLPRWLMSPDFCFPALLLVLWGLFFFDLLFSSKNLYFRDILNFHYPLRKVLIESLARWEVPLWNPYVYLGQPLLANPNYTAFYPTTLFHLVLPFNYAFKMHFVIHPLLGGLGLYFLQRQLRIGGRSAFAGALVYQFSGTVLSFLNLYNIVQTVALIPWIGWAFLGAVSWGGWSRSLLFGAILALQLITCEPLLLQCTLLLLTGLSLFSVFDSEAPAKAVRRVLRVGIIGGLFALALGAVQIVPTLELIPLSARGRGYDFSVISDWSMDWLEAVNVAVPNLLGNPYTLSGFSYWGEFLHRGREGYLVSFFLGSGTILVCCLSFFSQRRTLQIIMTVLTALSFVLALGENTPVYRLFYETVPGFSFGRFPCKYFLLTTITLSILTGLGLEVIEKPLAETDRRRLRVLFVSLLGLAAAVLLLGVLIYNHWNPEQMISWIRSRTDPSVARGKNFQEILLQLQTSIQSTAMFLTLAGVLMIASWRRTSMLPGVIILVVIAAEVIPANLRLVPLLSDEDVSFVPEVNAFLQENGKGNLSRVVPLDSPREMPAKSIWAPNQSWAWLTYYFRRSGQPMYGIMNGIQYAVFFAVDDLNTKESSDLFSIASSLKNEEAHALLGRLNSRLLLTVHEIGDPGVDLLASFPTGTELSLKVYELKDYLPRAYFVPAAEFVSSKEEALAQISRPDHDPRKTVVLETPTSTRELSSGEGQVRIVNYESSRVVCAVEARVPGFVVLLDSYYPGWRAYLDGEAVRIMRANAAFRAVEVPAGAHEIEFVYKPISFYLGAGTSIVALLSGMILLIWIRHKQSITARRI